MNVIKHIVAAVLGFGLIAGTAQAQNVDRAHNSQQRRVEQGVGRGSITPREAQRVERQQRNIHREETRMRRSHGGRLTRYDRARLRQREHRASRHIYRAKHNRRHYNRRHY